MGRWPVLSSLCASPSLHGGAPTWTTRYTDRATFVTLLSLSTRAVGHARRGASLGDGHQSVVYLGRSIHYTRPIVARHFGRGVPYLVPMGMEEECK